MDRIAGMNMHYAHYSFEYFLDSLDKLNLKKFELWAGSPHFCNTDSSQSPVPKMRKEIEKRNMKIVCVTPEQCLYPYNIAAREEELRKRSVDYFSQYIRQTAELGADKMLCGSGWGNYDEPVEEAWKRSADSLYKMTKVAEKENVLLAFEILLPSETNLVNSFNSTKRMMNEINSPNMKCCIDTVPVCYEGKKLEDFFREFGDRIIHIHLNDGKPDGHLTWGDGNQPLEEHLDTISKYNYSGYMTLELGNGSYYLEPEKYLRKGLETLKKVIPYQVIT